VFTVIVVEGIDVKAEPISRRKVLSIWKELSGKRFPKVAAFQLDNNDFDRIMKLNKCAENERIEMKEWGRVLSTKGTDACVFKTHEYVDTDYVILVRENPYHKLDEILKHELTHISRGDL